MFTLDSIISTLRWVLVAIGLVALVVVGMTACLTGFADWNAVATEAAVNHEASPALIPFIVESLGQLIATGGRTAVALAVGVGALVSAVLVSLAPRIASAVSTAYWAVRVRREATRRAVYCASVNTTAVAR
ncbi:MAG: hypothetical protein J0H96_07650 [Microbacterium ginsengisoli]|nr:hypothetical protein [Microbacterium ginsengisoli]